MTSAMAIIGANWGDEGKGLGTDALAHEVISKGQRAVVVRSNGGAQAGHGVERPDGRRHVFHHVASGTFAGASTHLSRFFVAHPMVLQQELQDLVALGVAPRAITIDPRAVITTPWDMAINQAIELARAGGRHGSTGLGFGEAIERDENGAQLRARDLWSADLRPLLEAIRDQWVQRRLKALNIDVGESPLGPILTGEIDLIEPFLADCAAFRASVELLDDAHITTLGSVIFEGAQGLQLDMDFGIFPHVTRSKTGLKNMTAIAVEAGISEIHPIYMTRAYATRHGAGPLPHEECGSEGLGEISFARVVDLTNAPNTWQGTIRHAALDADLLRDTVQRDLREAHVVGVRIIPALGVTCLDQLTGPAAIQIDARRQSVDAVSLPAVLARHVGVDLSLVSHGPCREHVALSLGRLDRHEAA